VEFKTKTDYDNFLKGNEEHIASKMQAGQFELFACNECLSHFDNEKERNFHKEKFHDKSGWKGHSDSTMDDSDFKNGGTVFN